jgi:transposase InsO family protein
MRRIDEQYLRTPFYGSRKLAEVLRVNRKRVQRLMRVMGIEAIYPQRRTTWPAAGQQIYPYLLRNVAITRRDQVWSSDISLHLNRQCVNSQQRKGMELGKHKKSVVSRYTQCEYREPMP